MAKPLSERPFPRAPSQTTRRKVLLALPAVAAVQTSVPAALANENQNEPLASEWCESEHVKRFYRLARF
jgi:hypothetical protein